MRFIPVKWFIDTPRTGDDECPVHYRVVGVSSLLLSLAFLLRSVAILTPWTGTNTTRILNAQRNAQERLLLSCGRNSHIVVGAVGSSGGTLGVLGASKKISIVTA